MKQLKLKCTVILLFVTLLCNAQLTPPFNIRSKQIAQLYQLNQQQANDYEKVLNDILNQWNAIKNSKYAPADRKKAEQKLQDEFCTKVRTIFPDTQYVLWARNHRGNLTVRFYKEDLGMNNEQFAKFRNLSETYSKKKAEISRMNILETERSERRKEALNQYSSGLNKIFSKELSDYLIYENQVLNAAKILSKKYTILSENKAIQCVILKKRYEENLKKLETQKLPKKQLRKKRIDLADNYDTSLRSIMSNEEYVTCTKTRDKLTDSKFTKEYKMSGAQLAKYKEFKKKLAMKQLVIKQNKKDKANKPAKLKVAETEFENEVQKLLGPQQFKRWKQNEQMKKAKNKKK